VKEISSVVEAERDKHEHEMKVRRRREERGERN